MLNLTPYTGAGWEVLATDIDTGEIAYVFSESTGALRIVDLEAGFFLDDSFVKGITREAAMARIDSNIYAAL